jgi:hypothetical protein
MAIPRTLGEGAFYSGDMSFLRATTGNWKAMLLPGMAITYRTQVRRSISDTPLPASTYKQLVHTYWKVLHKVIRVKRHSSYALCILYPVHRDRK